MAVARRHADISGVESLRHAGARPRCDHRRPGTEGGCCVRSCVAGATLLAVSDGQLGLQRRVLLAQPLVLGTHRLKSLTQRRLAGTLPGRDPARRGRGAVALRGSWASPTPGSLNTWPRSRRVRRRPRRSQCGQARCRVERAASNNPRRPSRPRSKAAARPLPLATTRMRGPASRERTAPAHPLHASRGRRLRRPPSGEAGA